MSKEEILLRAYENAKAAFIPVCGEECARVLREHFANPSSLYAAGARAEAVGRYMSKGSKVAVEGRLRYSSWERDGQRRSKLEVVVDEIELMSKQHQPTGQTDPAVSVYDEDYPF